MIYRRILLKLSGESLMGKKQYGIDEHRLMEYAGQIAEIVNAGVQVGIVIGGGNIFRGLSGTSKGFDRIQGDQMGMMATVINSLALNSALQSIGVKSRVLTAIRMEPVGEFYSKQKAIASLESGEVVIMSAGTGNPFFTTDTAASLRAMEIQADVILKATKVGGIYDKDPMQFTDAKKYKTISHMEVIQKRLKVMDTTAASLCMENKIPIIVLDLTKSGNIKRAVQGKDVGTLVVVED